MASDMSKEPQKEYGDYFEAKEDSGGYRIEYLKDHPKVNKLLFEAFYQTPNELKEDIKAFRVSIEEKYRDHNHARNKQMRRLFSEISFREGVDPREAFELINAISEYFRMKLSAEFIDSDKLLDDNYWNDFLKKRSSFLNMIRFGIEDREE